MTFFIEISLLFSMVTTELSFRQVYKDWILCGIFEDIDDSKNWRRNFWPLKLGDFDGNLIFYRECFYHSQIGMDFEKIHWAK